MLIQIEETLPEEIIIENKLIPLKEAVRSFHFPESTDKLNSARQRFKFEELFYLELLVALRKQNYQSKTHRKQDEHQNKSCPEFLKDTSIRTYKSTVKSFE